MPLYSIHLWSFFFLHYPTGRELTSSPCFETLCFEQNPDGGSGRGLMGTPMDVPEIGVERESEKGP